ncbi:MAG: hypothetical protein ABF515_02235 [Bifidobacterium sp.]|uniref:hypothetical protein n=1 Tax=Bifidobacterium sp. TaxID=41200 RepID=UPI0039E9815B
MGLDSLSPGSGDAGQQTRRTDRASLCGSPPLGQRLTARRSAVRLVDDAHHRRESPDSHARASIPSLGEVHADAVRCHCHARRKNGCPVVDSYMIHA